MSVKRFVENGLFITLEGPECGGKSTQSTRLVEALREQGHLLLETREPGGTVIGEELRRLLKEVPGNDAPCAEAELFMFSASRAQLVRKIILPHLKQGGVVVCDRFADSTTVYQGYARGLNLDQILQMHSIAIAGRWPDLTILLDLDPAVSYERGRQRQLANPEVDRFEDEERRFHERVRDGYLDLARKHPKRIAVVNAEQPEKAVHADIMEVVNNAIG